MRLIKSFDNLPKYLSSNYEKIEDGIYKHNDLFVTTLSFQQEPGLNEGPNAANISQYPLEDILDQFAVYISDFYNEKNTIDSLTCYLEFSGFNLQAIKNLRSIIGKHVYVRPVQTNQLNNAELVIE